MEGERVLTFGHQPSANINAIEGMVSADMTITKAWWSLTPE